MCGIVNLYSVRGRKPSVVCPCFLISNEFPARGRKRKARFIKRKHIELQFIPARGRKRVKCFVVHTHTQTLQFIPVRGRKRCIPTTYQSHVSTIPVRGRKLVRPAVNRCNVGTIPVRGRKLTTHGANAQTATLQFIPARGRKLHVQVKHAHLFHNCNLSPQGDKKAPLPLAFASSGGALLFLIFYFTGWELRLPESSL